MGCVWREVERSEGGSSDRRNEEEGRGRREEGGRKEGGGKGEGERRNGREGGDELEKTEKRGEAGLWRECEGQKYCRRRTMEDDGKVPFWEGREQKEREFALNPEEEKERKRANEPWTNKNRAHPLPS